MSLSSNAMRRYNHLIGETEAAYHDAAVRFGLSDSAMSILYTLCTYAEGYRCPLSEVCRSTWISKQTINSALRRLEADGAVYLMRTSGRRKDVCLTARGIQLAQTTVAKLIAAENAVFASWPEEDVETYLRLNQDYLTAFRDELDKQIDKGDPNAS